MLYMTCAQQQYERTCGPPLTLYTLPTIAVGDYGIELLETIDTAGRTVQYWVCSSAKYDRAFFLFGL